MKYSFKSVTDCRYRDGLDIGKFDIPAAINSFHCFLSSAMSHCIILRLDDVLF